MSIPHCSFYCILIFNVILKLHDIFRLFFLFLGFLKSLPYKSFTILFSSKSINIVFAIVIHRKSHSPKLYLPPEYYLVQQADHVRLVVLILYLYERKDALHATCTKDVSVNTFYFSSIPLGILPFFAPLP